MKVCGYGFRDHCRLLAPLFGLLAAVWVLRMILAAEGSPAWQVRLASVTATAPVAVLLATFLIHFRRFGSYPNIIVASLLLNAWAQFLIIGAILFSILTGLENIYTAPEFSMAGDDPLHLRHIYGHLTFGIALGTLSGAAEGSLLLWLLRKLLPPRNH